MESSGAFLANPTAVIIFKINKSARDSEEKLLWNQQKLKLPGVQWKRLVPCVQTLHVVLVSIYTVQRRHSPGDHHEEPLWYHSQYTLLGVS